MELKNKYNVKLLLSSGDIEVNGLGDNPVEYIKTSLKKKKPLHFSTKTEIVIIPYDKLVCAAIIEVKNDKSDK